MAQKLDPKETVTFKEFLIANAIQVALGALFFLCIFVAGLSSSISMLESFSSAALNKFNISREKLITIICIIGFAGSALYTTGAGVLILDIVDHFVGSYGIALCGLIEAIVLGYFYGTRKMRAHVNQYSDFKIGIWWDIAIKYLTPIVMGYMFITNIIKEFRTPYGGYPMSAVIVMGWSVAIGMLVAGIYFSRTPWKDDLGNKIAREVK